MSFDPGAINWLAVAITAIAMFFLGAIWYTALGKPWVAFHGWTPEQLERMKTLRPPPLFFGGMIACYALMAVVLAVLVANLAAPGPAGGMMLGAALWLGIAVPIGLTSWLASITHIGVYVIDLAYQLVLLLMGGAILGAWR